MASILAGDPVPSTLTILTEGAQEAGWPVQVSRKNTSWTVVGIGGELTASPIRASNTTNRPSSLTFRVVRFAAFAPPASSLPFVLVDWRVITVLQPAGAVGPAHASC